MSRIVRRPAAPALLASVSIVAGAVVASVMVASVLVAGVIAASVMAASYAKAQPSEQPEGEARRLIVMVSGQLDGAPTSGAGIIFARDGGRILIATANHVVRRSELPAIELEVRFRSQPDAEVTARLLPQFDRELDLGVISVEAASAPKLEIPFRRMADSAAAERKSAVYHVGFPEGRAWRSNLDPDRFAERDGDQLYFESMSIAEGDSGGGLFDERWELLGMVQADRPPEGRALRAERMLEKLREWKLPVDLRYSLRASTRLAFSANTGEPDAAVYTSRIDGSDMTRIAGDKGLLHIGIQSHIPRWSPDGGKLAFVSGRAGNIEIHTVDAEGKNPVNVTRHPDLDLSPSWSPDGRWLAFESSRGIENDTIYAKNEIWVVGADGSGARRLTENDHHDGEPVWSPAGDWIAYSSGPGDNTEIFLVRPDGSGARNLSKSPGNDESVAWSPKGARIAYLSTTTPRETRGHVYVRSTDGGPPRKLFAEPASVAGIEWSPDGTRLALAALFSDSDAFRIHVVAADGTKLVNTGHAGMFPSWSPDGEKISFFAQVTDEEGNEVSHVFVTDADGNNLSRVTPTTPEYYTTPSWSPFLK